MEIFVSHITNGEILWRIDLMLGLLDQGDPRGNILGHTALLLKELDIPQATAIWLAGYELGEGKIERKSLDTIVRTTVKIVDDRIVVPVEAGAYGARVVHQGDAT